MLEWTILLAGLLAAAWAFLRWFERANVYQPSRGWATTPDAFQWKWEDVRFHAADGTPLSGWRLPAPEPRDGGPRTVILLSHGNGGNISHRIALYELFLGLGLDVFAYDYRGYGRSEGRPTEEGTYLDAEAALGWLRDCGYGPSQVIAVGESLGGGIACELARRHPDLRGLILQSTFTSIQDVGAELFPYLPVRTVSVIRYDNRAKLPLIRVPVLILHSREDTLIPYPHGERNFAAANEPKWLRSLRGDHNDQPLASPEDYADAVRELLDATDPARVRETAPDRR